SDKGYFDKFLDEITVNTTEMFRDPTFWTALKDKVIPLFESHQTIRIWHAGCSSGEEVYTMCILLKELGALDKTKLYATDISSPIIEKAKKSTKDDENETIKLVITNREIDKSIFLKKNCTQSGTTLELKFGPHHGTRPHLLKRRKVILLTV
ncbi:MAG: hypothetical protein MJA29_13315, partial [Candidatus Omnitrophica bacterium]|nr:hypothetical protein [Candidatus Omnitrophota bacterium]